MITDDLATAILERLQELSPENFVGVIADHLRSRPEFSDVQAGPTRGKDKQVDISAREHSVLDESRVIVFQCKRYRIKTLGVSAVAETIQGMVQANEARECVIVSTREPSQDAREAIAVWQTKYNIRLVWKPWCGKSLARTLAENTPEVISNYFPEFRDILTPDSDYSALCPSFEYVCPPFAKAVNADRFYNGHPPNWAELSAGFDIERSAYSRPNGIRDDVCNVLEERKGVQAIALLGVGGTGKTTLLLRLGFDASLNGHTVLRLRNDWSCGNRPLSVQIKSASEHSKRSLLILIDDASDLHFEHNLLEGLLRELGGCNVVFAVAEHPERWSLTLRQLAILKETDNYRWHGVHRLLDSECEALVDRILTYEGDGTLSATHCDLNRMQRLALCKERADRHLVIAMLQMRHGIQFKSIIERELNRIPMPEARDGYALVSFANTFGVAIPATLLRRVLKLDSLEQLRAFRDSTDALFTETRLGVTVRNGVIARMITAYALPTPELRKEALQMLLGKIDVEDPREERIFLRFFTGENMHKRLLTQLDRKIDLVRSLYSYIQHAHSNTPVFHRKFLITSQAMCERIIGGPDTTRALLEHAIQIDDRYAFAFRQYAWLEHSLGHWVRAADLAVIAAELAPDHFYSQYQCGRILSLNTAANFLRAKQYINRAVELRPHDPKALRQQEDYLLAERILSYYASVTMENLIPKDVLSYLRPGLAFNCALYGSNSKEARKRLQAELSGMQESTRGDVAALYEKIGNINVEKNQTLKALFLTNLARLQYLEWYHRETPQDFDKLEQLFKTSIDINGRDPFSHCWYGTFLKEIRDDFVLARREYDTARSLGMESKHDAQHDHPLFLNNIALLLMDEVQSGLRAPEALVEAKALLEAAIKKNSEGQGNFFWPENSLSLCNELIVEMENRKISGRPLAAAHA